MTPKTFIPDKPCKYGHLAPRFICDNGCSECKRISKAKRLRDNPEKVRAVSREYSRAYHADPEHKASAKAYRAANREAQRLRAIAWAKANPERLRATLARYEAAHREKMRAIRIVWRKTHPERSASFSRKWYRANREKARAAHIVWLEAHPGYDDAVRAQRRAAKKGAGGRGITPKQWKQLLTESHGLCVYCNERRPLTVDHIEPLRRGGAHDIENVAPACGSCNSSKHDAPLLIWLAKRAIERAA